MREAAGFAVNVEWNSVIDTSSGDWRGFLYAHGTKRCGRLHPYRCTGRGREFLLSGYWRVLWELFDM